MVTKEIKFAISAFLGFVLLFALYVNRMDIYHGIENGFWAYPSKPGKDLVLDVANSYGQTHAALERIDIYKHPPLTYGAAMNTVGEVGTKANEAELIKSYGYAKAEGRTLDERPAFRVEASNPDWQIVTCYSEEKNKYGPCEFFPGNILEAFGEIKSEKVLDFNIPGRDKRVGISPCGIPETDENTVPFVQDLPRYALLVRTLDPKTGSLGDPQTVCDQNGPYQVSRHGFIETHVNGDYKKILKDPRTHKIFGFGYEHPEWFSNFYKGSFGLRIKRST